MLMKCKLRQIGNSVGVILPAKVITGYNIGDEIVITIGDVITDKVITPDPDAVDCPCDMCKGKRANAGFHVTTSDKTEPKHQAVHVQHKTAEQSHSPMKVGYVPPKGTKL